MIKSLKRQTLNISAAFTVGMMVSTEARAAGGNDFSQIAENIITSIQSLPGLLTGLAYMFGILLGVLGVLKIKDHVENPSQTPLKDGAIRLAAGGGLFALPIIYDAMLTTIGEGGGVEAAELTQVNFAVGGGG